MRKALNIAKTVLVVLFVVATIGMMIFTIVSVNTFDQNNRSLFGYKAFIVRSDSMAATDFSAGALIFVQEVNNVSELKAGDIISFISQNTDSFGETLTHKIREVTRNESGALAFVTYGTTTDTNDAVAVTAPYILGRYTGQIPGLGTFFNFLKTPLGYILCILIPALILIAYQAWNCIKLFQEHKKAQFDALQAERDQLAEERRKTEEMMRKLEEMQRMMQQTTQTESATKEE